MTYVLIWMILAGSGNNVAATGSAEFNSIEACQRAGAAIEGQVNPLRYVRAIAMCHAKGRQQ